MTTTWPATTTSPRLEVTSPQPAALRAPLLDLWRRNLPAASEHRCDWLYGTGRARAWLLGDLSIPAGAAGLMLRRMFVQGNLVEAGGAIDLNVDQSHRSVGPALTLVRSVVDAADAEGRGLIYGMPNASATAVMKRAGYRELGAFSSWTKLLDCEDKLCDKVHSPLLAKALAPLANKAIQAMSADWRVRLPAGVTVQTPDKFDNRFDRLSQRTADQFDVVGERSADYLNWRYTDCPELDYKVFALAEQATSELAGYLIWYPDEGYASISDVLCADAPTTLALLAEFSRHVRGLKLAALRYDCFAPPGFYQLLKQAGFVRRQDRHPVMSRGVGQMADIGPNWYLTMADSDTDV